MAIVNGTMIGSMVLPGPVLDAVASAIRREHFPATAPGTLDLQLAVDESFAHDGLSGHDLKRVCATTHTGGRQWSIDVIVKRWDPSAVFPQLAGAGFPLECLLYEGGRVGRANSIGALHVPTIGSVRIGEDAWIVMEDVSAETGWHDTTSRGRPEKAPRTSRRWRGSWCPRREGCASSNGSFASGSGGLPPIRTSRLRFGGRRSTSRAPGGRSTRCSWSASRRRTG